MNTNQKYLLNCYLIIRFSIFVLPIFLIISSCQKYVDIPRSSTLGVLQTAKDCQLLLDNVDVMNSGYPNDGDVSSDDSFLSDDNYLSPDVSQEDRDFYVWSSTAIRLSSQPQWINPYYAVYYSNLVLERTEKLTLIETDQITKNNLKGSALFFRAFAFWQLAQIYAKPYISSSAAIDLGIPLRLNSDINEKSERATVGKTYSQIIGDLQDASNLLPTTSSVPTRPNKVAAYSMLARTYLSMENYSQALNYANLALQLNNQLLIYSSLNSDSPFTLFNKEVIFQAVTTTGGVVNPSGVGRINPEIYNMYDDNDLRKSLFLKLADDGNYQFTGNYAGESTSPNQFTGLAVDELFLIRAECYARLGDITNALLDINNLLKTRWQGEYHNIETTDVELVLKIILNERRKELLMRGLRWTDLRRLNRDSRFSRTLIRTVQGQSYSLPPNDSRYTLLIPNEAIISGKLEQNIR